MSEVVNLAEVREAREQTACRSDFVASQVLRFRTIRSIAEADPDPPAEPSRIEDVRQISFDFRRDDAIHAALQAAHERAAAAQERIAELLGEIAELRFGTTDDDDPETVA